MQNFEHFELDGKDSITAAKMQLHADAVTDDVKDKDQDRSIKYQIVDDILSEKVIKRIVSWKSVVMYGLCLSLVGHYVGWTVSLNAGFWEVFGAMFVLLTSTGCLMLCIAEMTAALPFSGGTYGVVRVTLGDLPGYLVGTCEVLQNVLYVSFTVGALAKSITLITGHDNKFEPLYWLVFYFTIGIITSNHRTLFWRSVWVFGVFMCVMLLLYCTMTRTEDVNFIKYTKDPAVTNVSFHDHVYHFFKLLHLPSLFFNFSIKILPLACREAKNPTSDVPMAMYIVYAVSIVSAFSILFCASSIAPGVSVLRRFPAAPLSFGFSSIFNISMEQAVAFTMISQYASCLVFAFAFTQQMAALSKSGFLWNSRKWGFVPDRYDNVVSLLVGCGVGYLLNLLIFYWHSGIRIYVVTLFWLLGYSINLVVFVTYIAFRSKFPSLMKKFRSPLGVPGAVYGLLVYMVVWGCIGALSNVGNHWAPFLLLACFLMIWSLPFFLYYRNHLTFSDEERTVLFIAYVINANKARRLQKLHSPRSSTTTRSRSSSASERSVPTDSIAEEKVKEEGLSPHNDDVFGGETAHASDISRASRNRPTINYNIREKSYSLDETVATGGTTSTGASSTQSTMSPRISLSPTVRYHGVPISPRHFEREVPISPRHPDEGTPIRPRHPERGVPISPRHPDGGGVLISPRHPERGVPISPRHPDGGTPIRPRHPERGVPISPRHQDGGTPIRRDHGAPRQQVQGAFISPMPGDHAVSAVPAHTQADLHQPARPLSRVSSRADSLDSVLVTELGYERDILGHYHTEIEEYFASEAAAEEEEVAQEQLHPQGDDAV